MSDFQTSWKPEIGAACTSRLIFLVPPRKLRSYLDFHQALGVLAWQQEAKLSHLPVTWLTTLHWPYTLPREVNLGFRPFITASTCSSSHASLRTSAMCAQPRTAQIDTAQRCYLMESRRDLGRATAPYRQCVFPNRRCWCMDEWRLLRIAVPSSSKLMSVRPESLVSADASWIVSVVV